MDKYADYFDRSLVAFLCPAKLTADTAHKNPSKSLEYLRDAFMTETNKKDKRCKFIFAPYNIGCHWMLFVIDLLASEVFILNSITEVKNKELNIYPILNTAFQNYKANGGRFRKTSSKDFRFTELKCAKQTGKKECEYFLMKYMHEIVSMYTDCDNLEDAYFGTYDPYTTEELNDVWE